MNKTLFGLSLISYNWENGKKDILDSYIPLVCNILNVNTNNIQREDIKKSFNDVYGINIPLGAVESLLKRMNKSGLVKRINGEWISNHENISKIVDTDKSNELKDTFAITIEEIRDYSKKEFDKNLTVVEIEEGIISFFKEYDLNLLFANNNNCESVLPKVKESKKIKYIIAKYVYNLQNESPAKYRTLIKLAKGYTIASLITYDDINNYVGNLNDVSIYLDAPIIFNLIGLNGDSNLLLGEELINSLVKNGAKLKVFEINYGEVVKTIEDAIKRLNSKNYDITKSSRVLRTAVREGLTSSNLQLKLNQIDSLLKKHSIIREVSPTLNERDFEYQIDEVKLTESIEDLYKNGGNSRVPYHIVEKISRDVEAISNIFKIRKQNRATNLKSSKALLLTSNEQIAYAAKNYERTDWKYKSSIPTCVTDIFLSTILWANYPEKNDNLKIRQLMSECYNIIELDNRILNKFYEDVNKMKEEKLINDEQFYLLSANNLAYSLLEQKTFNDIEEYTDKTPAEILEDLELRINSELQTERNRLNVIESNIEKIAKYCGKVFFFFIAIVIILISLILKSIKLEFTNNSIKVSVWTISAIVGIFGFLRWMEIIPTKTKIESYVENFVSKFLHKLLTTK